MADRQKQSYSFLMFFFDSKYHDARAVQGTGLPPVIPFIGSIVLIVTFVSNIYYIFLLLMLLIFVFYGIFLLAKREKRKWKDRR